ncbi:MAG TPA: CRISPR-associated endonuclease Cas1 [Anaerolineales bacterium]|nr:CRISPR-associated endonuclease Cas1 [Anaerolineales bacterium]
MIIEHLLLTEPGLHVSKHSGRLRVTRIKTGERVAEAPLIHLQTVLVASRGVSLTAAAIAECAERGIPIHFVDGTGRPYGTLYSAGMTATILTRREQLRAYDDARGHTLVLAFARGKIQNQETLLRYAARYRQETAPQAHEAVLQVAADLRGHLAQLDTLADEYPTLDALRPHLMALEAHAAKAYWQAFGHLLTAGAPPWPGRRHRGAKDPLNSALNYGYGILYGVIERACLLAGLDPYAGYLHTDRPGKPSLVLDLIEEFRQPVVDRTVLAYFNRGRRLELDPAGKITPESRKALAEAVLERLATRHKTENGRLTLNSIIQRQARRLAAFLRGEQSCYSPYRFQW